MDIINELNKEFLAQSFGEEELLLKELNEYKQIASTYARIENAIAVLSDMRTNISYIYYGGIAEILGCAERGDSQTVHSIWEESIFKHIHPNDLSDKYLQELRFFHFLKHVPKGKRTDYYLMSKLRMQGLSGEYIPILHRMFYVPVQSNDSMWLSLCLYNLCTTDISWKCAFVNSLTGQITELEKQDCSNLLSVREKEVLKLIDAGKMSKDIAQTLYISINTVSRHRQSILEKLQVKNSIEACRIAKDLKLI